MVIALIGGPQAGTIGPLMAQNAGIIGGINKLRSAELLISGSSLQKVWNLRDAAATKEGPAPHSTTLTKCLNGRLTSST